MNKYQQNKKGIISFAGVILGLLSINTEMVKASKITNSEARKVDVKNARNNSADHVESSKTKSTTRELNKELDSDTHFATSDSKKELDDSISSPTVDSSNVDINGKKENQISQSSSSGKIMDSCKTGYQWEKLPLIYNHDTGTLTISIGEEGATVIDPLYISIEVADIRHQVKKIVISDQLKIIGDAKYLFRDFNGLETIEGMEKLDTSEVTNMCGMFLNCPSLKELDLTHLNTVNVTDMSRMFAGCGSLEELNFSSFSTSNVTSTYTMFHSCSNLKYLDLSSFDTSSVTTMISMFEECESLKEVNISSFDTSNVVSMESMFKLCYDLEKVDVGNFNTSNVTNMSRMFAVCTTLKELDLSKLNTANVIDMSEMLQGCRNLENLNVNNLDTSSVIDMSAMFGGCISFEELDLNSFDTSSVTDMASMFEDCKSLKELSLTNFDTSNVTSIDSMFQGCEKLTSLDIRSFNTAKVISMYYMFSFCRSLPELNISNFDTSNVSVAGGMRGMFRDCESLLKLDLSNFNTDSTNEMGEMFSGCKSIKELDLSNFNTSKVIHMDDMFSNCESLEKLNISGFDMESANTDVYDMLKNCKSLNTLVLGSKVKFVGDAGDANLYDSPSLPKWVNIGTNPDLPEATHKWTSRELMDNYDGTQDYDTYVRLEELVDSVDSVNPVDSVSPVNPNPNETAIVIVHYQDIAGNPIANERILKGKLGDSYITEAQDIIGYTLKERPINAVGIFNELPQIVVYLYTKNANDIEETDKPKQIKEFPLTNNASERQKKNKLADTVDNSSYYVNESRTKVLPQTGAKKQSKLVVLFLGVLFISASLAGINCKKKDNG